MRQAKVDLNKMADEYLADPQGYLQRNNVQHGSRKWNFIHVLARERYKELNQWVRPHVPFDNLDVYK